MAVRTVGVLGNQNAVNFYTGNGIDDFFELTFELDEDSEILVLVNGTATNQFQQQGNGIRFLIPPRDGASIVIARITDVTQLRDWNPFDSFPADRTEGAADKLILLKQEAKDWRANLNLFGIPYIDSVEIESSAGIDALIPMWHIYEDLAGVFSGEATEQAPPHGAGVIEPQGYVWFQYGLDAPPVPLDYLSSTLYPLDAHEDLNVSSAVDGARHWGIEWDFTDISTSVVSGTLVTTIAYGAFNAPPEAIDASTTITGGTIVKTIDYRFITAQEEAIDASTTITGGALVFVLNYIAFTTEPEAIDTTSTIVSGTLQAPPP